MFVFLVDSVINPASFENISVINALFRMNQGIYFRMLFLIDGCLQLKYKISPFDEADTVIYISSAEKQKGAINSVQRCSIENQKGAISIDFVQR